MAEGGDEGAGPGAGRIARAAASLRQIVHSPRIRSEIGWVVVNRSGELVLLFALLKVLTTRIGKAGYGEYNLAETAVILGGSVALRPVLESYLRDYHGSGARGEQRAAGMILLRWYVAVTLLVALTTSLLSTRLAATLDVAPWTPLAAGLLFVGSGWRWFGQDVLNIQRRRRAWALYNLGYSACLISAISATVYLGPATATAALFAFAAVAVVFAVMVAAPRVREILRAPSGAETGLPRMIWIFGVPFAALLLFQWIQGFGDRYLVKVLMDAESVGLYVAAYQVCGIPYAFVLQTAHNLLTPIAYQRSRDVGDPRQLWSADRLIVTGIAIQIVVGAAMLGVYALFGPRLLVLLTDERFALPATTLVVLAGARFVQSISLATQPIFAVHHRLGSLLWFRCIGAALTFGICWVMIDRYGILGAALGTCLALGGYLLVLVFGPGGCWWLVAETRRRAAAPTSRP